MKICLTLLFILISFNAGACPMDTDNPESSAFFEKLQKGDSSALPEFRDNAACLPWLAHYLAANTLFQSVEKSEKDEAIKWFYIGQFRARAASALDVQDATAALSASLNDVIGRRINEYAGGDKNRWLTGIDRALAWIRANPYTADSAALDIGVNPADINPDRLKSVLAKNMAGITELRAAAAAMDPEVLRETRRKNGLE